MITLKQFAINNILNNCEDSYKEAIGTMLTENQVLALVNGIVKTADIVDLPQFIKRVNSKYVIQDAYIDNVGDGSFVVASYKYARCRYWNEDKSDWSYSCSEKYPNEEEWTQEATITIQYCELEDYGIAINLKPYLD